MTKALYGIVFALVLGLVASPAPAHAGKVEKKFGGKIMFSEKRFPMSAKSPNAYISKVKKQSKAKFNEDKANKQWKVHFAAFFKKPLKDIEYTIKIYDLTDGNTRMVQSFEQYSDNTGAPSLISNLTFTRDQFGVNRKLLVTIESLGKVVASGQLQILGEAEKYSGKVDFSNDNGEDE